MAKYLFAGPTQQVVDRPFDDSTGHPRGPLVARDLGLNVYRLAGVWYAEQSPSAEAVAAADRFYLGGHVHLVDQARADELTAAGYGANLTPAPADPQLLAQQTAQETTPAAVWAPAVTPTTAGALLLALVSRGTGAATGSITSFTDSAGNTWTKLTTGSVSGVTNTRVECWVSPAAASITSLSFTSATSSTWGLHLTEWGDVAAVAPLDVASPDGSGVVSATAVASPAVATLGGRDLVVAAAVFGQVAAALDPGPFAALANFDVGSTQSGRVAYRTGAPPGSYGAAWSLASARSAGVLTVALKAAVT